MRPANIITAIADIWAGFFIAGITLSSFFAFQTVELLLLTLSTIGLYGGGIVFNDYFDAETDQLERPERPIPSGKVPKNEAKIFGTCLLITGIVSASTASLYSGVLAIIISSLALLYDKYGKHHTVIGPVNMGLCRSGNLLLGLSIVPQAIYQYWFMAILPLFFIAAITLTSQDEVSGNNRISIGIASSIDVCITGALIYLGIYHKATSLWFLLPFLSLWIILNLSAKVNAILYNTPENVMKAVKIGVISLIPLNASYAAGYGGVIHGLIVLSLLPISMVLAKKFAIT